MEDNRTLIEKSLHANIDSFVDPLEDIQLYRLIDFLLSGLFIEGELEGINKDFVDEFFGLEDWDRFVEDNATGKMFLGPQTYRISGDLKNVRGYLLFKLNHRFIDALSREANTNLELAQTKLKLIETEEKVLKTEIKVLDAQKSILELKKELES